MAQYNPELVDQLLDKMEVIVDRISLLNASIPDDWPTV